MIRRLWNSTTAVMLFGAALTVGILLLGWWPAP